MALRRSSLTATGPDASGASKPPLSFRPDGGRLGRDCFTPPGASRPPRPLPVPHPEAGGHFPSSRSFFLRPERSSPL